jgi:hypothetical protein
VQRYYFTGCDLRELSDIERAQLFACRLLGKRRLCEYDGELLHIDLECSEVPCACAVSLRRWVDGWSKMPSRGATCRKILGGISVQYDHPIAAGSAR